MDAFAELYSAAVPLQSDEEELEEVIKNELLAWKRSREEKVKKPQFPAIQGSPVQLLSSASSAQLGTS